MFTQLEKGILITLVTTVGGSPEFIKEFVKVYNEQTAEIGGVIFKGNLTCDQMAQIITSILSKVENLPLTGQLN